MKQLTNSGLRKDEDKRLINDDWTDYKWWC